MSLESEKKVSQLRVVASEYTSNITEFENEKDQENENVNLTRIRILIHRILGYIY